MGTWKLFFFLAKFLLQTDSNRTISDRTSGLFKGILGGDSDENIAFGYLVKNDALINGRNYFACLCNNNQTIITADVKRSGKHFFFLESISNYILNCHWI